MGLKMKEKVWIEIQKEKYNDGKEFISVGVTAKTFGTPDQIVNAIRKSNIPFDQLIREYDSWVHISFADTPRKQVLIIDKKGTRPYGT